MNKTQAIARLTKIVGAKKLGYRECPKAPTEDQREPLRVKFRETKEALAAAVSARDDRRAKILARDDEYQRLKLDAIEAEEAHKHSAPGLYRHRIEVLKVGGIFNEVLAEGDNWQQVVDIVEGKAAKS